MKFGIKIWIAGLLCLLAVGLLLASSWPATRSLATFDVTDSAFLESAGSSTDQIIPDDDGKILLPAEYTVSLDLPASLRVGRAEPLRLTIEQKGAENNLSPLAGWQASVESSLVFPDTTFRPQGSLFHRLAPDDDAKFIWFLTGSLSSSGSGTLWVDLLFTPPQGGEPVRVLIAARPLSFELATFFGMPTPSIQMIAWSSLVIGAVILVSALFQNIFKGKR